MAVMTREQMPGGGAGNALTTESAPSAQPDLSKYSKDDLANMLHQDASTIVKPPETIMQEPTMPMTPQPGTEPPPETKQPDRPQEPKPEETQDEIAAKFKNPDGSVNIDNLSKSYNDMVKQMSRQFNSLKDVDLIKTENQELKQQLTELAQFKSNLENQMQAYEAANAPTPEEYASMSPQEQQAYIDKKVESKMNAVIKQHEAKREMDAKINDSISEVSKMEGYDHLKNDISEILKSNIIDYSPEAPKLAYYASLGRKTPEIATQARNMGFSEGYAKAKAELGKQVDSGKSSEAISVETMGQDQLKKMSKQDLERMLPRYFNDNYTPQR